MHGNSVTFLTGKAPLKLTPKGSREIEGQDISGQATSGRADIVEATYRSARIDVLDVRWKTGLRDIRAGRVLSGREPVQSLARGRLRLGVSAHPHDPALEWCELRIARVKPGTEGWSNLVNASLEDLRRTTGCDPVALLVDKTEAVDLGTKAALLRRTDNTRGRLCLTFPRGASLAPRIAFCLTRVMPLEDTA